MREDLTDRTELSTRLPVVIAQILQSAKDDTLVDTSVPLGEDDSLVVKKHLPAGTDEDKTNCTYGEHSGPNAIKTMTRRLIAGERLNITITISGEMPQCKHIQLSLPSVTPAIDLAGLQKVLDQLSTTPEALRLLGGSTLVAKKFDQGRHSNMSAYGNAPTICGMEDLAEVCDDHFMEGGNDDILVNSGSNIFVVSIRKPDSDPKQESMPRRLVSILSAPIAKRLANMWETITNL